MTEWFVEIWLQPAESSQDSEILSTDYSNWLSLDLTGQIVQNLEVRTVFQ